MSKYSLEKVRIDGFRGLRNLSIEGLGALNILVGENNCGKTSVLEALSILCNPNDPYEWLEMVRRRDFGGLDETRVQSLRWCFTQSGALLDKDCVFSGECKMKCFGNFPLRSLRTEYTDIYVQRDKAELEEREDYVAETGRDLDLSEERTGAELTQFSEFDVLDKRANSKNESQVMQIWDDDSTGHSRRNRSPVDYLPNDTLTPYSYQLNRLQVSSHTRHLFDAHQGESAVLELVRRFDPEILDIKIASFRGKRPAIYVRHRQLGPAPLSVFGDALRRAVLLANTLYSLKEGGVLLIDEIEAGIHVSALQRVFAWLADAARQLRVQVVATTHSLEALDAVAESLTGRADDLVTFHLEQTHAETRAKRIEGELLLSLRKERGLDVR